MYAEVFEDLASNSCTPFLHLSAIVAVLGSLLQHIGLLGVEIDLHVERALSWRADVHLCDEHIAVLHGDVHTGSAALAFTAAVTRVVRGGLLLPLQATLLCGGPVEAVMGGELVEGSHAALGWVG